MVRVAALRALRPVAERAVRRVLRCLRGRSAGDDEYRAVRRDRTLVIAADLFRRRRTHDGDVSDRRGVERMAGGVDQLAPGPVRHRTRVALVLLELRERLAAHELDLRVGQRGRADRFGDEREQFAEIVAETLGAEHRRMRAGVKTRDRAQIVERAGPGGRVAPLRAAQHRLGGEARDPRPSGRLEPLTRLDGEKH